MPAHRGTSVVDRPASPTAGAGRASRSARARRRLDLSYGPHPLNRLDFYPADTQAPQSLVVYMHGGGWVTGNRHGGRLLAAPFNAAGYALASVDYRLVPETDLAGCVADVASAVAHLLNRADAFGIDPDRCVLMGHSAGAHMAALLATDERHLRAAGTDARRLAAVVTLDGIFDVTSLMQVSRRPSLPRVFGRDPELWRRFSPVRHVGTIGGGPKFCLIAGDGGPHFVLQLEAFEAALRQVDRPAVSMIVHGLRHAELILRFNRTEHAMQRFVLDHLP